MRDPRYAPRAPGPSVNVSYVLVVVLFIVFLVGAAGFVVMALGPQPTKGPNASPTISTAVGSPTPEGSATASTNPTESLSPGETPATPGPGETPGPSGTPGAAGDLTMPMVPVVDYWSSATDISISELTRALKGQSETWSKVILTASDREPLATALGIKVADSVETGTQDDIRDKTRQGYLAVIRASDLDARVRALSLGGKDLVGVDHITKLSDWPLVATVSAPATDKWTAEATWTINAGGDMFLDRGVRNTTLEKGMGVDYPFDGGTAKVTGHCRCSASREIPNELVPIVKRTGNAGMVRDFVEAANLTLANLENPVPNNPSWHLSGTNFGGPPRLLPMFTNAGIDWVSLANNHMNDYGSDGIIQTRKHLKAAGIPFSGAGKNLEEAGQIGYLQANGLKVGLVACVLVPGVNINATEGGAGTFGCKAKFTVPKIREAKQNADVVIVFAHWGNEFRRDPFDSQVKLAQKWVDAGADLVLGAHTHVYGGLQALSGKPVIYSMGNFIFDQYWSTPTMESALTEVTFQGTRVVQIRLHPYVILDQAQPNFLNPATDDGKALLDEVKTVSDKLGW